MKSDPLPGPPPGGRENRIEALLFDLGGVLIELDWDRVFEHWASCCGADAAALRALAPSTLLQLHPADPSAFSSMARLLRAVPAYTLELGPRITEIPRTIERFLAGSER